MRGDGDRNAKLISSQGELYKSAVSPLKNHPELREPKGVLTAHRICRELDGTVATTQELSEAGFLANLSGDAILTGDEAGFRDSSINVTLYNPSTKKIEIREVANIDAGKDKSAFRYACSTSRKQSLDSGNAKLCYLAFAYELNRGDAYFASTDKWINFAEPKPTAEAIKAAEVKKEAYKKQFWDPSLVEISECQAEYERFSAKSTNCKIVYDAKLDWYSIYKDGTLHVDERWNKYGGSSNGGRSNPYAEKFLAVLQKEGTCNSRSVALSEYRIYAPIFSEVLVEEKTAAVDSDGCKCGLTDSLPKMCIVFKGKVTFSGFLCPLGTTTCCTQDICSNLVAKSKMEGRTIWTEPTECNGKAVLRQ